jgi:hypothetical protein
VADFRKRIFDYRVGAYGDRPTTTDSALTPRR